jgi:tRNA G10  N-methylase Trm11
MYIAILGRQPNLGMAELERLYGSDTTAWFSSKTAIINSDSFSIESLGGTQKAGRIILDIPGNDWRKVSMQIVLHYKKLWQTSESKVTLGISAYDFDVSAREVQKTGIILKQRLKETGISLRLIPNEEPTLNTATSHHNKLGLGPHKIELLVIKGDGRICVAESIGAQNITSLAKRDQGRPRRDAFVGMLPPKLAQIMINLAIARSPSPHLPSQGHGVRLALKGNIQSNEDEEKTRQSQNMALVLSHSSAGFQEHLQPEFKEGPGPSFEPGANPLLKGSERNGEQPPRLLDPFCGTGVVLQEAALMGYSVYGTDLSEKMIRYSRDNLNWLQEVYNITIDWYLHQGDAMTTTWHQPINTVVGESYLGQPFSAPPSSEKLAEVRRNCNHILSKFLKNIATQIEPETPLCIAIPAWKDEKNNFTHLPLISQLSQLGFQAFPFKNIQPEDLLYYRKDQIVARELLVLKKS